MSDSDLLKFISAQCDVCGGSGKVRGVFDTNEYTGQPLPAFECPSCDGVGTDAALTEIKARDADYADPLPEILLSHVNGPAVRDRRYLLSRVATLEEALKSTTEQAISLGHRLDEVRKQIELFQVNSKPCCNELPEDK